MAGYAAMAAIPTRVPNCGQAASRRRSSSFRIQRRRAGRRTRRREGHGRTPGGGSLCDAPRICQAGRPRTRAWALAWAPRMGPGIAWADPKEGIPFELAHAQGGDTSTRSRRPTWPWCRPTTKAIRTSGMVLQADYPNDGKPIVLASHYGQMGEAAAQFLLAAGGRSQVQRAGLGRRSWTRSSNAPGFEVKDLTVWSGVIESLIDNLGRQRAEGAGVIEPGLLKGQVRRRQDRAAQHLVRTGRHRPAVPLRPDGRRDRCCLSEYLEAVKQRPAGAVAGNLRAAAGQDRSAGRNGRRAEALACGIHTLLNVVKPCYRGGCRRRMGGGRPRPRACSGAEERGGQVRGQAEARCSRTLPRCSPAGEDDRRRSAGQARTTPGCFRPARRRCRRDGEGELGRTDAARAAL